MQCRQHNPKYTETSPMAHGRTLPLTSSLSMAKNTYSYDTFSKYPIVLKTSSKATEGIKGKFQQVNFTVQTTQMIIHQQNFMRFMTDQHIQHITSSPLYPKSNGFIERQVETIKMCQQQQTCRYFTGNTPP